ncbi:MAG: hypothetical protein IJX77_06900 [Ruminococcus sp.]|nr:hypothetical protein [Ruminococcus sp.]
MDNNTFDYTYSAQEREELLAIQKRYKINSAAEITEREATMEELRKLDKRSSRLGKILTAVMIVSGTLIFGTGMSIILRLSDSLFALGIVIGVIGIAMVALTFPVRNYVNQKQKERIAPKILSLTEKLLHGENGR